MSFSTEIKNEICMLNLTKLENISELAAFLRNSGMKDLNSPAFITENPKVARRMYSLLKSIYEINPIIEQIKGNNFIKRKVYDVKINEKKDIILKDLMVVDENNQYMPRPKSYLIDTEDLSRAYLRGIFLATGSINDPKTSRYHMEFLIDYISEAKFVSELLLNFNINSKIILRDKGYMLYVKEAEKIGDFLRIIQANRAVLYYEDIRIYRDHKNMTNRLNNCEQANVDKIILSSEKQLNDIDLIITNLGLDILDDKLKEVVVYRKKYPEVSLSELSNIITMETGNNITKSGLNHRMRKIQELANKLK